MKKISLNNLIFKAKSHVLCGELDAAKSLYLNYLSIYPNNRRIKEALSKLPKEVTDDHQLSLRCNKLINLFNEGYFKEVIDRANKITKNRIKFKYTNRRKLKLSMIVWHQ